MTEAELKHQTEMRTEAGVWLSTGLGNVDTAGSVSVNLFETRDDPEPHRLSFCFFWTQRFRSEPSASKRAAPASSEAPSLLRRNAASLRSSCSQSGAAGCIWVAAAGLLLSWVNLRAAAEDSEENFQLGEPGRSFWKSNSSFSLQIFCYQQISSGLFSTSATIRLKVINKTSTLVLGIILCIIKQNVA